MAQEFLPKDIKTYPEATSLQNFNAFGFNSETGAGENLPGSVIQAAIDAKSGAIVVTYDGSGSETTFAEIEAAYTGGKYMILLYDGSADMVGRLTAAQPDIMKFNCTYRTSNGQLVTVQWSVTENDEWTKTVTDVASKEYVDNVRLQLASVSSASWTGAATASIDLDKLTDFGEIPAAVTGLTISITAATAPMVSQCAFQFSLAAGTTFASLAINLSSTACKIANAPDTWETGKTYQVTMINGCAVVGVFG